MKDKIADEVSSCKPDCLDLLFALREFRRKTESVASLAESNHIAERLKREVRRRLKQCELNQRARREV